MGNLIRPIRELLRRTLNSPHGRWPTELRDHSGSRWMAAFFAGAALLLWAFLSPKMLMAQDAATPPAGHAVQKPAAHTSATARSRTRRRRRLAEHPEAKAAAAQAPAPPKPNWPIDQPPNPPTVTWDSRGLSIEASNSSLDQILQEITMETGVKLQGLSHDERIFGNYGPGPAREVLSNLLDGSGYNVLMIGGSGDEPPQQIILSPSAPAGPQPANAAQSPKSDEESDADDQPQPLTEPVQPMPLRSPFGPGAQRVPLEMQQDMQIRQQQMEQQREQQQQNNPQQ